MDYSSEKKKTSEIPIEQMLSAIRQDSETKKNRLNALTATSDAIKAAFTW
jgi:hypothetical protein